MIVTHSEEEIDKVAALLVEILKDTYVDPEKDPVLPYHTKQEMVDAFFEAEPPQLGMGLENALKDFRERILSASVKTWHPLFLNQMFAGSSFAAIVGDLLISMMNPTLATWEMSPAGTVIERSAAQWMAHLLGMPKGSSGIFLPGGSMANLMALTVARNTRLGQDVGRVGLARLNERGVILCSEACHYSIANAANILGIGAEQVIKIATNHRNEMIFEAFLTALDDCAARGLKPFVVVATMGITVTGGFDPLDQLGPVCRERGIHLHVDAAFGGGVVLSESGRHALDGIQYADTVIWDAHKWLHVPLTSSVLLTPDPQILREVFSSNANYLFHRQDEGLDLAEDLGHFTALCGKRFEALRLWLLFKAYGEHYFRGLAEERMNTTRQFAQMIETSEDFELSFEPRSPIVCWRFRPEALRGADVAYMDALHRHVRESCKREGIALFNMAPLKGELNFRAILVNPLTSASHLTRLLDDIRCRAERYVAENPPQ